MRVATRISIATGTLLVLHLTVLYFHTAYARDLAAANLEISKLNPALKEVARQPLLPDKVYPVVQSHFRVPSSNVRYLTEAQSLYLDGRNQALETRELCIDDPDRDRDRDHDVDHRILDAQDIQSIIPQRLLALDTTGIALQADESDGDSAATADGTAAELPSGSAETDLIDNGPLELAAVDRDRLEQLLCHVEHENAECIAAHSSQKIIALWDALLNGTAYFMALSGDEPAGPIPFDTPRPDEPVESEDSATSDTPGAETQTLVDLRPSRERESEDFWSREAILEILLDIKREGETTVAVLENAISEKLDEAQQQRRSTEQIALWMTGIASALALFLMWITIRSFLQPVRELKAATRAVAEGQFRYQLDTSAKNEFSGLSASFNRMVTKIAELDQLKSEFLSHISHELRTPLAAMQETTNLLLDETPGPVTPKQRRLLELTNKNCRRLTTMITQLLDLSRMSRGVLAYDDRAHDFGTLVESVAAAQGDSVDLRGVRVTTEVPSQPVIIRGDQDRLTQVVENLLTNAIKFSPPEGSVTVRITHPSNANHPRLNTPSGTSTESDLVCSISDHGPGVPDLHKERIFEKFHQVDRRPKGSGGGVGLGLAICREIIVAHDGEIWVADNKESGAEDSGSTFYFTLPESRLETSDQGSLI